MSRAPGGVRRASRGRVRRAARRPWREIAPDTVELTVARDRARLVEQRRPVGDRARLRGRATCTGAARCDGRCRSMSAAAPSAGCGRARRRPVGPRDRARASSWCTSGCPRSSACASSPGRTGSSPARPAALVDPVPFLGFLDTMPSAGVFVAIQVVGTLAAAAAVAAALTRRRPQAAYAVAWVCYLVLAGLRGSRGKVLHNDLLLLWVSAPFLLRPGRAQRSTTCATASPGGAGAGRSGWRIVITALIYFFAGYHKLRRSGLEWAYSDNMRYVALWGPSIGAPGWPGLAQWVGEQRRGWRGRPGSSSSGFELTFPVVIFVRWTRVLYAAGRGVPARHDVVRCWASTTGRGRSPCRWCWSTGPGWSPGRGDASARPRAPARRRRRCAGAADGAVAGTAG